MLQSFSHFIDRESSVSKVSSGVLSRRQLFLGFLDLGNVERCDNHRDRQPAGVAGDGQYESVADCEYG
jgi:hypothetical protein